MRFKKSPQLPGAGRTWAGQHHGSHMPTSTGAILLSKMACQPKHFGRQCIKNYHNLYFDTFFVLRTKKGTYIFSQSAQGLLLTYKSPYLSDTLRIFVKASAL